MPNPTDPVHVTFCREMRRAAQARAELRYRTSEDPIGSALEPLPAGNLVCTVIRQTSNLYQERWHLAGREVSRSDAEAAVEAYLADAAEDAA